MFPSRNRKSTTSGFRRNAALLPALGTGFPLLCAMIGVPVARSAAADYQPYKDAAAGFALARPDGWQVSNEGAAIWVKSPDKSELLLTEVFHAEPGETSAQWLEKMGDKYGAQFPQAQMDNVTRQSVNASANGDEIVARMHYQGPQGAAQMRVLCSIIHGKGLLCVMAAPSARFTAEQPKLLHIAQSLRFVVPRNGGQSSSGRGAGSTAAQMKATERSIHWATWQDPREHAFSVGVPQGWTTEGGAYRENGGNVNFFYTTLSPNKDTFVMVGTPNFLSYTQPSQMSQSFGWQEGTHGVLHYMRSPEFNDMYLHKVISNLYDGVTIGKGQELEQASERLTQQANQVFGGAATVSYGVTDFKCTVKETGMVCNGILLSTTTRTVSPAAGEPVVTWFATTDLIVTKAGDAKEAVRVQTATAIFDHLSQTFHEDPRWEAQYNQQSMEHIKAQGKATLANIAAVGERSRQIAANSSAAEDAIMGRYNSHVAAGNAQQSAFADYIGDRTHVTDSSGHTYNVGSGYSNYYKNDRTGTILGTDSAYSPGVDFTPMTEH